jgi:hypothetical protein
MLEEFSINIKPTKIVLWNNKLFKVNNSCEKQDDQRKILIHTFMMKAMFLCKWARPDITTAIGLLLQE